MQIKIYIQINISLEIFNFSRALRVAQFVYEYMFHSISTCNVYLYIHLLMIYFFIGS